MSNIEIYRCRNCGWVCNAEKVGAIGTAHAHAEKHAKAGGILPAWIWPVADPKALDKFIERVKVEEYTVADTGFESEEDYDFFEKQD